MRSTLEITQMKFGIFWYNFQWPHYVWLLDGWTSRLSMAMPIIGYLILFNDTIATHLSFERLASGRPSILGLTSYSGLAFIYIGLTLVGAANIAYYLFRPKIMTLGTSTNEYVESGLKNFTFHTYLNFHDEIRYSGYEVTSTADYYDSEWQEFCELATGRIAGSTQPRVRQNWVEAKSKFEGLLRSILREIYVRRVTGRRFLLVICILMASIGYSALLIPSTDLFLRVISAIFASTSFS